jgi:predicted nucleic acid-binding protein
MASRLKVLVDTSIWINILRVVPPWTPDSVSKLIANTDILVADLVFVEVVRGARTKPEMLLLSAKLREFEMASVCGAAVAHRAVEFHQILRSKGKTIRGTVDLLLATWCIENDIPLLHADRDLEAFEQHLGLKRWPEHVRS